MQNKLHLSQKLSQKLSPQQIQLMKLLQVPTAMLEQRVQEELEANPALEEIVAGEETSSEEIENSDQLLEDSYADNTAAGRDDKEGEADSAETKEGETVSEEPVTNESEEYEEDNFAETEEVRIDEYLEDYMNDDTASYRLESNNYSPDQEEKTIPIAVESSFHEHLEHQLGLLTLNERETSIAQQIIGSIDEDGYLRRSPMAITDDLAFAQNLIVSEDEVYIILKKVQSFEPAGIGAQNLQECLLLQLEAKLKSDDIRQNYTKEEIRYLKVAYTIIDNYFEEFSKKHYKKLMRQLSLDRDELREATNEVLKLNPKPGGGYAPSSKLSKQYIVPDFIVENKNGELELRLNTRNAPELRVNQHYKEMLSTYSHNKKDKKQREAAMFVKQKIDAAKWFIDAIRQRQETMTKTMYTILQYQYEFFLTGDEKRLKPMILKDIAEITGLDISTVSRVANSKYVQTEFGTKRLKDFFSEALQTDSGESVSTLEVKKILTEIISAENKRKPYSDEKLKDILQGRGYNIARRTVAKYREQLNIPVARLRKEI
ncbi:MAG: RNA polymerase factor sigma-54 [Saprospiraceae bacterium]|nr:RNA polymerase factor sigma-54 [Saprospiraceae bacterium]